MLYILKMDLKLLYTAYSRHQFLKIFQRPHYRLPLLQICSGSAPVSTISTLILQNHPFLRHEISLLKLRCYGIDGNSLALFCSFLRNRKQHVGLSGYLSNLGNVLSGVPQRSVLGPLLFVLYIHGLCHNISVPAFQLDDKQRDFCRGKLKERNANISANNSYAVSHFLLKL